MSSDHLVAEIEGRIVRRFQRLAGSERKRVVDGALGIYSQTSSVVAFHSNEPVALVHEATGSAFSLGGIPGQLLRDNTMPMPRIPYLDNLLQNREDPPQHGLSYSSFPDTDHGATPHSGHSETTSNRGPSSSAYHVREAAPRIPHYSCKISSKNSSGGHGSSRRTSHQGSGVWRIFGRVRGRRGDLSEDGRERARSNERFRQEAEEAARRADEEGAQRRQENSQRGRGSYEGRRSSTGSAEYCFTETRSPAGFEGYSTNSNSPSAYHTQTRAPAGPYSSQTDSVNHGRSSGYYTESRAPADSSAYHTEYRGPGDTHDCSPEDYPPYGSGSDHGPRSSGFRTETRQPGGSQPQTYPHAPSATETQAERFERLRHIPFGYYEILGVGRNASQAEIRKAYKKLSLDHHPDRNSDDKEHAERRFAAINEAHQLLSNKRHRELYDRCGLT